MAPSARSLRKTACTTCVTAKRRCDSALPACSRCTRISAECKYPFYRSQDAPEAPGSEDAAPRHRAIAPHPPSQPVQLTDSINVDAGTSVAASVSSNLELPQASSLEASETWDTTDGVVGDLPLDPSLGQDDPPTGNEDWTAALPPVEDSWLTQDVNMNTSDFTFSCHPGVNMEPLNTTKCVFTGNIDFGGVTPSWLPEAAGRSTQEAGGEASRRQIQPLSWSSLSSVRAVKAPRLSNQPYWPRGSETDTWMFCARELLSFVETFAKTGSSDFILPPQRADDRLILQRALGVCAARETLSGEEGRSAFESMLDAEVAQLVESSTFGIPMPADLEPPYTMNCPFTTGGRAIAEFRAELTRLQAMVLYQTIRLLGPSARERKLGEELEPLLAAWTRELLIKLRMHEGNARQHSPSTASPHSNEAIAPDDTRPDETLSTAEVQCAYRTVLVSYMVRGVYSALVYRICHLVSEMSTILIPVPAPPPSLDRQGLEAHKKFLDSPPPPSEGGGAPPSPPLVTCAGAQWMSYAHLGANWDPHAMAPITEYDSFIRLLVVACKGADIIPSAAREVFPSFGGGIQVNA